MNGEGHRDAHVMSSSTPPYPQVKAFELRNKTKAELSSQLTGLRKELTTLRVAQVSKGAANKLARM